MQKSKYFLDYLASRIICTDKMVPGYSRIYYKTTDDLLDMYLDIDFYNKKVLSVLGSGDQVLTARYLDAKSVDAFDSNRLPLYYFYLRIWSIKYMNTLYPPILEDNTFLIELLKKVQPTTYIEKRVLLFFLDHIKNETEFYDLFYKPDKQPEGKTIFTKAEELKDCTSPVLNFYNMNLFTKMSLEKTYDIAIISNILEWARSDSDRLAIAHANLSKLVRKDGIVICSSLIDRSEKSIALERDIFTQDFTFEQKNSTYTYIKK